MNAKTAKAQLRCGETATSYLKQKKVMQKICRNGKQFIIHAGAKGYKNNYSPGAKKSFRKRHGCPGAYGTPRHLACEVLWPKGSHNKYDTK